MVHTSQPVQTAVSSASADQHANLCIQMAVLTGQASMLVACLCCDGNESKHPAWCRFVPADQWRQDPRLPELGLRGLFDAQQLPHPPAEAGGTSSRKQRAAGMSVVGEDAHRRWRYQLGVAEGDREIPSGKRLGWLSHAALSGLPPDSNSLRCTKCQSACTSRRDSSMAFVLFQVGGATLRLSPCVCVWNCRRGGATRVQP